MTENAVSFEQNDCAELQADMPAWLRGEVSEADAAHLRLHVDACADCAEVRQRFAAAMDAMSASARPFLAPASLTDKVFAHVLLDGVREEVATDPRLTDRTLQAVLSLPRALRKYIPLHWQLLRSTLAACILSTIALYALFTPFLGHAESVADKDVCSQNLHFMGKLIKSYPLLTGSEQSPLEQLEGALRKMYFESHTGPLCGAARLHDLCSCPCSRTAISYGSQTLTPAQLASPLPGSIPIVWDLRANHEGGRNVLFLDGTVSFLKEEDFLELMRLFKRGAIVNAH